MSNSKKNFGALAHPIESLQSRSPNLPAPKLRNSQFVSNGLNWKFLAYTLCMSNMSSTLSSHNFNVINRCKTQTHGCNCRIRESCPPQKGCLTPKIVYRADVRNNTNSETKFYFGLTETPFKERFGNHTRDFKHKAYSRSAELSKYIWHVKETGVNPIIKWSIVEKIYWNTKINYCKLSLL